MKKELFWAGVAPSSCDVCSTPINGEFIDGKVRGGGFAFMCLSCHTFGPGTGVLGIGFGQRYRKQPSGRFLKVEG